MTVDEEVRFEELYRIAETCFLDTVDFDPFNWLDKGEALEYAVLEAKSIGDDELLKEREQELKDYLCTPKDTTTTETSTSIFTSPQNTGRESGGGLKISLAIINT